MKTFPKLVLFTSKDETREILQYALITKNFIYAIDGYKLIKIKTSFLFNENFINSLNEDGILLHRNYLKQIGGKNIINTIIDKDNVIFTTDKNITLSVPFIENNTNGMKFVNCEAVIPVGSTEPVENIGLNLSLIEEANKLIKSMKLPTICKFSFYSELRPVIITFKNDITILIMHSKVN